MQPMLHGSRCEARAEHRTRDIPCARECTGRRLDPIRSALVHERRGSTLSKPVSGKGEQQDSLWPLSNRLAEAPGRKISVQVSVCDPILLQRFHLLDAVHIGTRASFRRSVLCYNLSYIEQS